MLTEKELNSNISRQWGPLPAELFKTQESYYVFDTGTVNFLEVNEIVFKLVSLLVQKSKSPRQLAAELPEYSMEDIREALDDIKSIQEQGYLNPYDFKRENPFSMRDIKEALTGKLQGLYLNITSKCNLSCSYCIFGGDYTHHNDLAQQEMSWDVAREAMDFFLSQSREDGPLRVDFFGGEPLLSFGLIERVVNGLKEKIRPRNQELAVTITSNGTVMNDKIADFLIRNGVILQISVDGEKELHDGKRKFKNSDAGSFDTVMKNLQLIRDRDAEHFSKNIRLKAVLTTESYNTEGTNFFTIPLVKELNNRNHFTIINQNAHYNVEKDEDYFSRLHDLGGILLEKKGASNIKELLEGLNYKKKSLFHMTFCEFFTVQIVNGIHFDVEDPVPYLKDCLIGIEGCVNVDGSISICYKSNSFIIGNVLEKTWYFDKIEEYHKKRYSQSNACKHCFVQRFCQLCYEKITERGERFEHSLKNFCDFNRHYYRLIFQYMLQIMDNNPMLWDELQALAEKEKEGFEKRARERAALQAQEK